MSSKSLEQIAQETGGKLQTDRRGRQRVQYQVKGTKDGKRFKSTGYIYGPEDYEQYKNYKGPVASDAFISDYGKDNYKGPAPITPASLTPVPPLRLPGAPTPANPGNVIGGNNAALVPSLAGMGYSLDSKGQYTFSAPRQEDNLTSLFKEYLGNQVEPPNLTSLYDKVEKDARIRQKEAAVQSFTNQINQITSKAQAESLALEGQGRGITESIIGGQQAQINREAAIQALPIQAQLAAATGDLESARSYVAQRFNLLAQDAQAQYNFKTKLVDSVYNFATEQEKRRLDAIQKKEDQAFQLQLQNLKFAQEKELITFKAGLDNTGSTPSVSFEDYIAQQEKARGMNIDRGSKLFEQIKNDYSAMASAAPGFMSQPAWKGLSGTQQTQAASLNNLISSLSDYRAYYNANVGSSGAKLTGEAAGVLESKLNGILFAAAQAEGTGALQKADREVIEKIFPNPTSIGGAVDAFIKGGKQGSLTKLDEQIKKYTNNLNTYGLQPVIPETDSDELIFDTVVSNAGGSPYLNFMAQAFKLLTPF